MVISDLYGKGDLLREGMIARGNEIVLELIFKIKMRFKI